MAVRETTLTVADIDRWDADAVREVFHAAFARGCATREVARQLDSLAVFDTWSGVTALARRHANSSIRMDLDAHGVESLAVAQAAARAADGIATVQSALRTLRLDAAELRMTVDQTRNTVIAEGDGPGSPVIVLIAGTQLQRRLDGIVAAAMRADRELASAIDMADGDVAVPSGPHDDRPDIHRALSDPLPTDPKRFAGLWAQLTGAEKDWLYARDHDVGNHPGMAWDPPDHRGRDHYNRLHLCEIQAQTRSEVTRLEGELDRLSHTPLIDDGVLFALRCQLADAHARLAGYVAVQSILAPAAGPRRFLGLLDESGHGAVSIGNPDTATRNAVFIPGTGQGLDRLPASDAKALAMQRATLAADTTLSAADVAVTTWMGYDRPVDLTHAASARHARGGAAALDEFERGQRASHVGGPSLDTVIGHSYGSTLIAAAASGGRHLEADAVVAVGSPGMLVTRASALDLRAGAVVYAMRAGHDAIAMAGLVSGFTLGADPMLPGFGARRLFADAGPAGPLGLPSVGAHSSYWTDGNSALRNLGAVIAGRPAPKPLR